MAYYPWTPETGAEYTLYSPETGITAVLNQPLHPSYAGMLTEITGLDGAEVREQAEDLVESDGGVHGNFYLGRRPIVLTGKMFGHVSTKDRQQRLDLLKRATQCFRQDGIMRWKPSVRNENVVPNPRMIGSTFPGWSIFPGGGSRTAITSGANAPGGTGTAIEQTYVATGAGTQQYIYASAPWSYVDPDSGVTKYVGAVESSAQNVAVQGAAQLVSVSAGPLPTMSVKIRCWNSSLALTGEYTAQTKTMAIGSWITLSGSVNASLLPAGTAYVSVELILTSAAAATYVWRGTNMGCQVRWDTAVPAYIDGASGGGYWWGDANNSPSGDYVPMQINFRRQQPYRESGAWVKDFQVALVAANPQILGPYTKIVSVAADATVFGDNQGNATYYPIIDLYSQLNGDTKIQSGNGGQVWWIYGNGNTPMAAPWGRVDTAAHNWYFNNGGTNPPTWVTQNNEIDWSVQGAWPSSPPGGTNWTLDNGPTGGFVNGRMEVRLRDAWV